MENKENNIENIKKPKRWWKAGRRPTGIKRKKIMFSCQPEEEEIIRQNAEKKGLTLSKYIISMCI